MVARRALDRVHVAPSEARVDRPRRRGAAVPDRGRWRRGGARHPSRDRRRIAALVPRQRAHRVRVVGVARRARRQGPGPPHEGRARRQGQGVRRRAQPLPLLGPLAAARTRAARARRDAAARRAGRRPRRRRRGDRPRPVRRHRLPAADAGGRRRAVRHQPRRPRARVHARLRPRSAGAVDDGRGADGREEGQVDGADARQRTRRGSAALLARRPLDRDAVGRPRVNAQRAVARRAGPPRRPRGAAADVRLGSRRVGPGAVVGRRDEGAVPRRDRRRAAGLDRRRARRRCRDPAA